MSIGRGFDDNVNQGASNSSFIVNGPDGQVELPLLDDFLPQRDGYTTVNADYVRGVGSNGSLGFMQFQARRYDQMRGYNTGALYAGIEPKAVRALLSGAIQFSTYEATKRWARGVLVGRG